MNKVYRIGKVADIKELSAEISLSTIGVAASVIKRFKSNTIPVAKAVSGNDDGGNIQLISLGPISDLRGCTIKFRTSIFFPQQPIPVNELLEKAVLVFSLRGGEPGTQTYIPDSDDISVLSKGKLIVFEKSVKLL